MSDQQAIHFDRENAESLAFNLTMGLGSLDLHGNSEKLLDAEFDLTYPDWQPKVDYKVQNGAGRLSMIQPNIQHIKWNRSIKNHWNVGLSNTLPLDMALDVNAGSARLDLSPLQVRMLDAQMNAGAFDLVMMAENPLLQQATIEINASKANIQLGGAFPELRTFDFEINASRTVLDLSGDWQADQEFVIEANAGWLSVRLPRHIGVQVAAQRSLTRLHHPELELRGGYYVNAAFGQSPVSLYLDIASTVGKLDLVMVDKIAVF